MPRPRPSRSRGAGPLSVCLAAVACAPAFAAGFAAAPPSARALALGGTGVASAEDVSAIDANPGALAFVEEGKLAVGAGVLAFEELLYQGLRPGPGSGTSSELADEVAAAPHLFWKKSLGKKAALGVGAYAPFAHRAEWEDPGAYAGRFVSTDAELLVYDLNPTFAVQLSPSLGFGVGATYRWSSLEQARRLPLVFDGQQLDVATLDVDTSFDDGFGWNAGFFLRTGKRLRWGLAYRSAIEIDYDGEGRLTQILTGNAQVDALVAASLPLDSDLAVTSRLELPDRLRFGLALDLGKDQALTLSVEGERTGWSSVPSLAFDFPGESDQSFVLPLALDDAMSYRLGLALRAPSQWEWRFGYAFEETPQPSATVGAFLADADRQSASVGLGRDWLHLALVYRQSEERTVLDNVDQINGRYRGSAWLLALTVTH